MGGENSRQYNHPDEEELNGGVCAPPLHAYSKKFKCDQPNCETIICKKCMGAYGQSGQRYCVLCALAQNIQNDPDEWEDLGNECYGRVIGSFEQTISVKADKETG